MHKVILWVQGVLVPLLGPPGVFVVAFLDSSFLSLPEINDVLVVTAAAGHARLLWLHVLMATLGSVAGCSALWALGRKGGEPLLVRRFGAERVERTRRAFARWDVLALAVPSILPPPMPFKVFVLSSGVFGIPYRRLFWTLLAARGARYTFWGMMGVLYGQQAIGYLEDFDRWFAERAPFLAVAALAAAAAGLGVWLSRRLRAPSVGPS
jgi:membrane protein YqaA with SNARE-associated domain